MKWEYVEEVYREVDEVVNEFIIVVKNGFFLIVLYMERDNVKGLKMEICFSYED